MTRNLVLLSLAALLAAGFAGCVATASEDALVLAFTQTGDDLEADKDPQRLATWIEAETGRETTIRYVPSPQAAIEAMRGGQADAGFFDGSAAWFAWKNFGFEAIAADVNSDGRDHYVASAWVRADSGIETMADLEGKRSCHTGLLKSAGMFMPLGWMIGNGLVEVRGNPDDIGSIEPTVRGFFSEASIPSDGPYYNYEGALRCLSEDMGDVAFGKDTTVDSYCGDEPRSWCLPVDEYVKIQDFGQVPSHPVMVRDDLPQESRDALAQALLALNDDEEGQAILAEVLETDRLVATTSQAHLGDYGANLQHVPGIQTYVDSKLQ